MVVFRARGPGALFDWIGLNQKYKSCKSYDAIAVEIFERSGKSFANTAFITLFLDCCFENIGNIAFSMMAFVMKMVMLMVLARRRWGSW